MAVLINKTRIDSFGDGVKTEFEFDFVMLRGSRVKVWVSVNSADYIDVTNDISFVLNTDQDSNPGGVVTYPIIGEPLTSSDSIVIGRKGFFTQLADYTNYTTFDNQSIEYQLDIAAMERQELKNSLGFASETPLAASLPNETTGYQDAMMLGRPIYSNGDDNKILITGGAFVENSSGFQVLKVDGQIEYDFGGSLNSNTWYYISIDISEVTGQILTAGMLRHSSTRPAYNRSRNGGYYQETNMCIFAVLTDSSGDILPFSHDGGRLIKWNNHISEGNHTPGSTAKLIDIDSSVPRISFLADIILTHNYVDAGGIVQYSRRTSSPFVGRYMGFMTSDQQEAIDNVLVNCPTEDTSVDRRIYIRVGTGGGDTIDVHTAGWYLPRGL